MYDALQIAATGMQAQQLNLDTLANNLANVNTPAFKRVRLGFHDLVTRLAEASASTTGPGQLVSTRGRLVGVAVSSPTRVFDQGELRVTSAAMDLAIAGEGFLEVTLADGTRAHTRGGALKVNEDGWLALATGPVLGPGIRVPEQASAITIDPDGTVHAHVPSKAKPVGLGKIDLVRFLNTAGLVTLGDGLYQPTALSGEPIAARPGDSRIGTIQQGQLEASNVKLTDEMVSLMVAQRAYAASVKVAQAADEMLGMVNGLRK